MCVLGAADNGQMSSVCLLDLTAAFDTVDHDLLLLRLFERQFGQQVMVDSVEGCCEDLLLLRLFERQFGLRGIVLA